MLLQDTLEKFFAYLQSKGSSPHTLKAYRLDLLDYIKHFKEEGFERPCEETLCESLVQATSVDLNSYRIYLGQSAPATIARKFATLRKFLFWAHKEGLRVKAAPDIPILPKKQPLAPRWLKKNEINELLRKIEKDTSSCCYRNVSWLLRDNCNVVYSL